MGITVTSNLGLIKPDTVEKIKEDLPTWPGWAAHNGTNCDKLDTLFRRTNSTYSPTLTASTSNPTLGAGGSVTGKFFRIFPRVVVVEFRIDFGGAGFAAGSGFYMITLPVAMDASLATLHNSFPVGKAYLHDDSTITTSTNLVTMYSPSLSRIFWRPPAGSVWTNTSPITLAQNDKVSGYFMYMTEVA